MRYATVVLCASVSLLSVASIAQSPQTRGKTGADSDAAQPGDEQLTCEQIYAQGMAQSQRDQQERNKKNEHRRAQSAATAALIVAGSTVGQLDPSHATALAANKAAENMADTTIAELGATQSNPRMDHLKQLWAQKHCVTK